MSRDPQNPPEEIAGYDNEHSREEGAQGLYPGDEGAPPEDLDDAQGAGQRVIGEQKERRRER